MTKLKEYNRKRDFEKTTEPQGNKAKNNVRNQTKKQLKENKKSLKFVVQHHIATRDHYDFRLEWQGVLLSWAVPKGPSYNSNDKRLAIQVEDHPLEYGNFEGTIPKGQYGGGTVMLWDTGSWKPSFDVDKGLKEGVLKFELYGKRLMGKWALIKLKDEAESQDNWILIKEKDEFDNKEDITRYNTSIKTKRTMEQIAKNEKKIRNPFSKFIKQLDKITVFNKTITIGGIKITNPNKVMFEPNIKKIDIIRYYVKIAKKMLPYLTNRIISIVRCPKGRKSQCFFKKHPSIISKGIVPIKIKNNNNKQETYFYIEDIYGLIFEAQMNSIEFHIWGSRIDNLEYPDIMVFDLDPDEEMSLKKVRQGVRDLKSILDELSLTSFLKISGGKGYHLVVPFKPSVNWDQFYDFAKNVSKAMELNWPDRYTSNIRKDSRKGKIFIDWERNGRGSTTIAPYSVRAKEGATISMPISWEELDKIAPNEIDIKKALKRLEKSDPWKNFFKVNQRLNP